MEAAGERALYVYRDKQVIERSVYPENSIRQSLGKGCFKGADASTDGAVPKIAPRGTALCFCMPRMETVERERVRIHLS
jgi:hypothetical protein